MDSVKESILDNLNEKITSPLVGGFVISWIVWNYKTILILLSTKSVEDKFAYIENIIYKDWWSIPLCGFVFPLITSVVVILALPRPERMIYRYWHQHKKLLKDDKQNIDGESLLSKKASRELRKEIIGLEAEHDKEVVKKDFEINELKNIIAEHEQNKEIPIVKNATLNEVFDLNFPKEQENNKEKKFEEEFKINHKELKFLKYIFDKSGKTFHKETVETWLDQVFKLNIYQKEKFLDKFLDNNLIFKQQSNNFYSLQKNCIDKLLEYDFS